MPFSCTLHKVSSLLSFIAKTTQVNFLKSSTLIFFPISTFFPIPNGIDTFLLWLVFWLVELLKKENHKICQIFQNYWPCLMEYFSTWCRKTKSIAFSNNTLTLKGNIAFVLSNSTILHIPFCEKWFHEFFAKRYQ